MKMKSEMHYDLTDLTSKQIEVICLGLDEIDGPDMNSEMVLIAKELVHTIDEGLKE